MDPRLRTLTTALGYDFHSPQLLTDALTHPSADSNRGGASAFERMEFLGDRALGLAVADMLLARFPAETEGDLARRQAMLVSAPSLAKVARELGIDQVLILSKGEEASGAHANPSMLADACEAVIGAIFIDGGLPPVAQLVRTRWQSLIDDAPPRDAKTALQEWAQGRGKPLPEYTVVNREGPAHGPRFTIAVAVQGEAPAEGEGASKRAAEQAAATALMARIVR